LRGRRVFVFVFVFVFLFSLFFPLFSFFFIPFFLFFFSACNAAFACPITHHAPRMTCAYLYAAAHAHVLAPLLTPLHYARIAEQISAIKGHLVPVLVVRTHAQLAGPQFAPTRRYAAVVSCWPLRLIRLFYSHARTRAWERE